MRVEKSVKIKAREKPEFHVYVYMNQDGSTELKLKVMGIAADHCAEWTGEGTDGKTFDISLKFQNQINASSFVEDVKKLPITDVNLSMWDGNEYRDVPTLH